MDIKVFRPPTGQDDRYPKVERVREDQKKKKDDNQQQKKKKNEKMESIFSSLAENLSQDEDPYL